jgi:hypothetical protein
MFNRSRFMLALAAVAVLAGTLVFSPAGTQAASSRTGFGFNATVAGAPGAVRLTGGGSYDASTASNVTGAETTVSAGGGFRCVVGVSAGPLNGCATGEGVRWDSARLLASTNFKCSAADVAHVATTDADTMVVLADFYRAGDGNSESFTSVPMFVSETDLRPDLPGDQTVWIQGVGCVDGKVNFSN